MMIFREKLLSLQVCRYRVVVLMLLGLGITNIHAQSMGSDHFHTIGDYCMGNKANPRSPRGSEGLDEDAEESNLTNPPEDSLRKYMPMVALPLKRIRISSPFGTRRDPVNRNGRRMHNGLDLKARFEEVYSMLPGIVTKASFSTNGGHYVTVNHGACVCSYLHLSKIMVKAGQHVNAGETIAISGNSGKRTTGPHLHIACRLGNENGKFFNPMLILGFVSEQLLSNKLKRQ